MRALIAVALSACAAAPGPCAEQPAASWPKPVPLPPYGGAERIDACAVRLNPAEDAERHDRLAAMRAQLPPGTLVELTELGASASRIVLPRGTGPVMSSRQAAQLANQFVRTTAELWGVSAKFELARGAGGGGRKDRSWTVSISAPPAREPVWNHEREVEIVIVIERRTGRLGAALVRALGPPDPVVELCPKPATPPDDGYVGAVLAHERGVQRSDIGPPEYIYFAEGGIPEIVQLAIYVKTGASGSADYILERDTARVLREETHSFHDRVISADDEIRALKELVEP